MYKNYTIKEPFFEYGPKCYMYGDVLLNIAKGLDELAEKYDVDVVLDVPDTEIYILNTWTVYQSVKVWVKLYLKQLKQQVLLA